MLLNIDKVSEKRLVLGCGKAQAKIFIVGDLTSGFDNNKRHPFSGPSAYILETCLHAADIIRGEVWTTNLFKAYMPITKFFDIKKRTITTMGMEHVEMLKEEIEEQNPNIIIAMGEASLKALCGVSALGTLRGYLMPCQLVPGKKVIGTIHPSNASFGKTINKYIIISDMQKAKEESEFPELKRPERNLVIDLPNLTNVLEWLDYFATRQIVGFDIEVLNYEVSCISFSSDPTLAVSIPLARRWTLEEELQIWAGIQRVLGNPNSIKVVQNGMFDIPFLHEHNGIVVRGEIHDTMIAHSIMYSSLPKGLNFLGSIYCGSQEYWKGMVKFKNIKESA